MMLGIDRLCTFATSAVLVCVTVEVMMIAPFDNGIRY
jgi:hypothetical protein